MYHANEHHTGDAAGCSDITSTNCNLAPLYTKQEAGQNFIAISSIADGKIYVGTQRGSNHGALYKFDLATGLQEK